MKNYFAKYLPIEGEIKEGDIILIDPTSNPWSVSSGIYKGIKQAEIFAGKGHFAIKPHQ